MPQILKPCGHLLEIFMPYRGDEKRMIEVLCRAADFGFYKGVELGIFFDAGNRRTVRGILESYGLHGATFAMPYVRDRELNLSSFDPDQRRAAVALVKELAGYAAECGYTNFCVPGGPDPGPTLRGSAKNLLADSVSQLAEACASLGLHMTLEPLDRYAFKKQLIGPMDEAVQWFLPLHAAYPNFYLHWDSAHVALDGTDLLRSLDWAGPYIAQFHLCNAILDIQHPCYGDLHMDVGTAPGFETEGFLTPELGAEILKKIASFEKPAGAADVYASVEVLGHPGDDLWLKERNVREFLAECFRLAGIAV